MGASTSTAAIQALQIPIALLSTVGLDVVLQPDQAKLQNKTTFDYIVVGCGTAGSVVASRLVEENNSVLCLEAGDDPPITAALPGLFVAIPKSYADYDYQSTDDPYAASSQGGKTTFTAGKMLGGSSSLNHLLHIRGSPSDFDNWANITNDQTWAYNNFLPYFIKSERTTDKELVENAPDYHGTNGPIGLSRQTSDETKDYLKSFAEAGQPSVLDLNGETNLGYTQPQFTMAEQKRQWPVLSYLKPNLKSRYLKLSKNTRVSRIIFEGNVAVGVEAIYKKKTYAFRANKEVILSAGVYNTPQVLMLSGIGHKDHLKEMNIDVVADLPVGDNFIEQVSTLFVYKTNKHLPVPAPLDLLSRLVPTKIPFSGIFGSVALDKSKKSPDYQTTVLLLPHDTPLLAVACRDTFWYRSDICNRLQRQAIGRDAMFTLLSNVVPKSRGTIRLKSKDPFDDPVIKSGFLTDEQDLENMVKFVRNFNEVGNSTFFKKVKAELAGLNLPECKNEVPDSDDFWRCYVKNMAIGPYHGVGTCPMGSVVDSTLLVKGFKRLRVVDASIMPVNPTAPPNAAVIAIAEKAVDLMKKESYYRKSRCRV